VTYVCCLLDERGFVLLEESFEATSRDHARAYAQEFALLHQHYGSFEVRRNGEAIDAFRPAGTTQH
jgi:hypothetical protein